MVTLQLTEGEHIVKWTLAGYDILEARISVSSTGFVTCLSVTGSSCSATAAPKITISNSATAGATITGYLAQGTTAANICAWISVKGGPNDLSTQEIMELVDAKLGFRNIGFTPTTPQIMGVVDYRMGFVSSGNSKTGCSY